MLRENLIHNLREFGLSDYEAKAYLALTINGPMTASGVADKGMIPQSKVYGILKSLSGKFLAESWSGKPIKFKTVEPEIAFKKILEKKKMSISILEERSLTLVDRLKPLREFKTDDFGFWSSSGKLACMEKAAEMLSRAKRFGFATTSKFSRYPPLDNEYIRILKKGVKVRMLGTSELDGASKARASWYANHGADVRILPMDVSPIIGIIDDSEVSFRMDNSDTPDMIWSKNPSLISVFRLYFEDVWNRAEKFKA
jgi:HTH-type transcriptional regulator, sugar sensing transcriptional regulator